MTVDVVDTSVVDVATAVLAIVAFLVLNRWHGKLTVLYVVLGCGVTGALLQPPASCSSAEPALAQADHLAGGRLRHERRAGRDQLPSPANSP